MSFVEKNIAEDPEAMQELQDMGSMGTPTIVIDGKMFIGFQRAQLEEALSA